MNKFALISRLSVCFLLFVLCLLLGGSAYQWGISQYEDHKFKVPGRLVDIGGYSLHLNCTGAGSPTVILEAGLGSNSLDWSMVQPEAAKLTRVCSYDRAGSGWSESSPKKPRVSSIIAQELHALLQSAGLQSPYILVGSSFGGINVRMYERKFPDEVAGIVLVDSSHEQQFEIMNFSTEIPSWSKFLFVQVKAYTGWTRIEHQMQEPHHSFNRFDEETRKAYLAKLNTTNAIIALAEESENFLQSTEQMKEADGLMGNKPLIVITAGKYSFSGPVETEETKEQQRKWNALQLDLVSKSSAGKQIIAKDSGHGISIEEPKIIVDAIKEIFELISQKNQK